MTRPAIGYLCGVVAGAMILIGCGGGSDDDLSGTPGPEEFRVDVDEPDLSALSASEIERGWQAAVGDRFDVIEFAATTVCNGPSQARELSSATSVSRSESSFHRDGIETVSSIVSVFETDAEAQRVFDLWLDPAPHGLHVCLFHSFEEPEARRSIAPGSLDPETIYLTRGIAPTVDVGDDGWAVRVNVFESTDWGSPETGDSPVLGPRLAKFELHITRVGPAIVETWLLGEPPDGLEPDGYVLPVALRLTAAFD